MNERDCILELEERKGLVASEQADSGLPVPPGFADAAEAKRFLRQQKCYFEWENRCLSGEPSLITLMEIIQTCTQQNNTQCALLLAWDGALSCHDAQMDGVLQDGPLSHEEHGQLIDIGNMFRAMYGNMLLSQGREKDGTLVLLRCVDETASVHGKRSHKLYKPLKDLYRAYLLANNQQGIQDTQKWLQEVPVNPDYEPDDTEQGKQSRDLEARFTKIAESRNDLLNQISSWEATLKDFPTSFNCNSTLIPVSEEATQADVPLEQRSSYKDLLEESRTASFPYDRAVAMMKTGDMHETQGDLSKAISFYENAVIVMDHLRLPPEADEEHTVEFSRQRYSILHNLAISLAKGQRLEQSLKVRKRAVEEMSSTFGPTSAVMKLPLQQLLHLYRRLDSQQLIQDTLVWIDSLETEDEWLKLWRELDQQAGASQSITPVPQSHDDGDPSQANIPVDTSPPNSS